jgi:hypothetical protein
MPRYRLHLEWDDDYGDRERAKEDLASIFELVIENHSVGEDQPTLQMLDVQSLPTEHRLRVAEEQSLERRDEPEFSIIPTPGITHPWDQGLWIFPDDHPMATYERAAYNREQKARRQMLELGEHSEAYPPIKSSDPDSED